MKKVFTSLFLLMFGVMATYATDYDLYVCGTRVTSSNAGSIATGVKYDASSTTLTLTNCTLDGGSNYAIRNEGITNLKIKIVGSCTVKANTDAIYLKAVTEINGVFGICGTLNVESTSPTGAAIWVKEGSTLRLYNLWLTATGKNYCLFGDGNETLSLSCCVMTAKCTSSTPYAGAVHGFSSASFDAGDAYLTTGAFNSSANAVCESSSSTDELYTVETNASLYVGSAIVRMGSWSGDLTPSEKTAGTISWSGNSTKTLTLNGVEMNTSSSSNVSGAIRNNKIDGLIVKIEGNNDLQGASGATIVSEKSMTIKGDGHLLVGNATLLLENGWTGIYVTSGTLTFDNATVGVECNGYGISGANAANLVVKNSLLYSTGAQHGNIMRLADCTLDGCVVNTKLLTVEGVCWRKALKGFGTTSGLAMGSDGVHIAVPTEWYNVSILGTMLSDMNDTQFAVDGLTEGTISYDKANKVLTLDGVEMTAPEGTDFIGVKTNINNAYNVSTIALTGTNKLTTNGHVFSLAGDVTFEGNGSLIATSNNGSGVSMYGYNNNASLTINVNNTVKFFGKKYGVWGNATSSITSDLILKKVGNNSDYYFQGTTTAAVKEFGNLTMTDMDFWSGSDGTPGCYYDNEAVRQNGGNIVNGDNVVNFYRLEESDKYGICIANVELTRHNHLGLGSKYITAGGPYAVTSDTNGNISLDNVTIDTGDAYCSIATNASKFDNLTFTIYGDCELKQPSGWMNTLFTKNTTIKGDGNLTIGYDLSVFGDMTLTLDNVNINTTTIDGSSSNPSNLVVKLTTPGKRIRTNRVKYFKSLNLVDGTQILEPEGAHFDAAQQCVVNASGTQATGIVFADASATGIEGVIMNADAEVTDVFDAEGRQLNEMQPGVNIVRMSDGTTKKIIKK